MTHSRDVSSSVVIDVLRRHGVEISQQQDGEDGMMLLVKGDTMEAQRFTSSISNRKLQYFSRKYEIPIHHFYRPEMAPSLSPQQATSSPELPN
jgi:hypothetical protein